ncbi:uncharacterized protein LOC141907701 isoform X2 [Tubulanus polymorphus]|uniref:uncharacterized protein LOC141907701 isoform X2 n=1 Tax=Tubulanus polymorphus TaxID=672921 RepID=UPI003DA585FF
MPLAMMMMMRHISVVLVFTVALLPTAFTFTGKWTYSINFITGDVNNAQSPGKIYVQLYARDGSSTPKMNIENSAWVRNTAKTYIVKHSDLFFPMMKMVIGKITSLHDGWFLKQVEVTCTELNTKQTFIVNKWFHLGGGDVNVRTITPQASLRINHDVTVKTASGSSTGTVAKTWISLVGNGKYSGRMNLWAKYFSVGGSTRSFLVYSGTNYSPISKLEFGLIDNKNDGWRPEFAVINTKLTSIRQTFPNSKWLDGDGGDKKITRVIAENTGMRQYVYQIKFVTHTYSASTTVANAFVQLEGNGVNTGRMSLNNKGFTAGSTRYFRITSNKLACPITKVTLGLLDNINDGWKFKMFDILCLATAEAVSFTGDFWLDNDNGPLKYIRAITKLSRRLLSYNACSGVQCKNAGTCNQRAPPYMFNCVCKAGWEGTYCQTDINECIGVTCKNGGKCAQNSPGKGYRCVCAKGWKGTHCETDINECIGVNCKNGGKCAQNSPGKGYRCVCAKGWKGTHCETDINECIGVNCKNGGKCAQNAPGKGYKCVCAKGWKGTHCETDINECIGVNCKNGGKCAQNSPGKGYKCVCAKGWKGTHCETDINECIGVNCKNGGKCAQNSPGKGYRCVCAKGWKGTHCETDINECIGVKCKNGGKCAQNSPGKGYRCVCAKGWEGTHCENDINECLKATCHNGGTCKQNAPGLGHKCICAKGWEGQHCLTDTNECIGVNCKNGGKCEQNPPGKGYRCVCAKGWEGTHCETDTNECIGAQCKNGATCIQNPPGKGYRCVCKKGWEGTHCETDTNECLTATCYNRGTCQENPPGQDYRCICATGWEGSHCRIDTDECIGVTCQNGGYCANNNPGMGYRCDCVAGFKGKHCETDINECKGVVCHGGGTCVQNAPGKGYKCTCSQKKGVGIHCRPDHALELTILIDSSSAVYSKEFEALKSLAKNVVSYFTIGPKAVRIATSEYGGIVNLGNILPGSTSSAVVISKIDSFKYDGARPYTHGSLDQLKKWKGARPGVPKALLVIGSGESTDYFLTLESLQDLYTEKIRVYMAGYKTESNVLFTALPKTSQFQLPYDLTTASVIKTISRHIASTIDEDTNCNFGKHDDRGKCVDVDECKSVNPCHNGGECVNTDGGYTCNCPVASLRTGTGETFCKVTAAIDVVVIIESSRHVYQNEWPKLLDLYRATIRLMHVHPDHVRVSLMSYSSAVSRDTMLDSCSNHDCLMTILRTLEWEGESASIEAAFTQAISHLLEAQTTRPKARKVIVYFGSGNTEDEPETRFQLNRMARHQITMYPLTYGDTNFIATSTNLANNIMLPDILDYATIWSKALDLSDKLSTDSTCNFGYFYFRKCQDHDECANSKNLCFNGGNCQNVDGTFKCPCTAGDKSCKDLAVVDLAVMLDTSNSPTPTQFAAMKTLFDDMAKRYFVHPEYTRVASAHYSSTPSVELKLSSCKNTKCVTDHISGLKLVRTGNTPKLSVALDAMRMEIFGGTGARKGVPNIIVYIGSGMGSEDRVERAVDHLWFAGIRLIVVVPSIGIDHLSQHVHASGALALSSATSFALANQVNQDAHCRFGFTAPSSFICADINECKTVPNPCSNGGKCVNTVGSHNCPCGELKNCVERVIMDIAIYIDASDVVTFKYLNSIAVELISHYAVHPDYIRIAAALFSSSIKIVTDLDTCVNSHCIIDKLGKVSADGKSQDGWLPYRHVDTLLSNNGARGRAPKTMIVISTGTTTDKYKTLYALTDVAETGTRLYTLTTRNSKDVVGNIMQQGINGFAIGPVSLKPAQITSLGYQLAQATISDRRCSLGYHQKLGKCVDIDECSASDPCANDGGCVNKVGYFLCPCSVGQVNCVEMVVLDLAIVIDSSSAIYPSEFPQIVDLTKRIIRQFYVHRDFVRIALATYADTTKHLTTLGQCSDADCVIKSLSGVLQHHRAPATHAALNSARSKMLVTGGRASVPKVVLCIGSGIGTERTLTMKGLGQLWNEKTRVYGLLYNIEDDVIRMSLADHYYIDIPFTLTNTLLATLPGEIAHKISDDLMCPYGAKYSTSKKTCEDVNECANGFPCFTGGVCINSSGSFSCL